MFHPNHQISTQSLRSLRLPGDIGIAGGLQVLEPACLGPNAIRAARRVEERRLRGTWDDGAPSVGTMPDPQAQEDPWGSWHRGDPPGFGHRTGRMTRSQPFGRGATTTPI